jgi:hypothetical protein
VCRVILVCTGSKFTKLELDMQFSSATSKKNVSPSTAKYEQGEITLQQNGRE